MGQLFTRISTNGSDQQSSTIITENSFVAIKPVVTKRKHIDQNHFSKKRKIDSTDRFSSRSNLLNSSLISQSLSPMALFKCQLCHHCFATKDTYLDHMMLCAFERHASIKIVRAQRSYSIHL